MCKPIKVGAPVDEGFKLMEDIRVDKTMVNGKAEYKAININFSFFNLFLFHVVKQILTA
jgi:hypothetical protein